MPDVCLLVKNYFRFIINYIALTHSLHTQTYMPLECRTGLTSLGHESERSGSAEVKTALRSVAVMPIAEAETPLASLAARCPTADCPAACRTV